jgi:putative endonuclease
MQSNKDKGKQGEDLAAQYLLDHGYTLLERNWRYRHAEVDLIVSKGNRLHLVEVKTRHSVRYGMPEESFNRDKMRSLKLAAEGYQDAHPEWKYLQFDIVSIIMAQDTVQEIRLFEDVYF